MEIYCQCASSFSIYQLLDESEQNIMICQWRATSYLPMPKTEANLTGSDTLTNHDILQ